MLIKNELLVEIKKGLYSSWYLAFSTNDTPYVSMKPEYLTTILLGKHLSEYFQSNYSSDNYMVRFEEQTKDVARRAFSAMPLPYSPKNVHGRATKPEGEEGFVDITLYQQKGFFPETRVIIEVKNFDKSDTLLISDLDRNEEFMLLTEPKKYNQISFGILTFYLHDKNSRTKEEADDYLNKKTSHYQQLTNKYCSSEICATLKMDSLVNYPNLSNIEAVELDEDGRQNIETEENHHIVFGIICMERKI